MPTYVVSVLQIYNPENVSSAECNNKLLALILKLIYIIGNKFNSETLSAVLMHLVF